MNIRHRGEIFGCLDSNTGDEIRKLEVPVGCHWDPGIAPETLPL